MKNFKSLLQWLNDNWKTISAAIGVIIAAVVTIVSTCSCGSTVKALVQSPKDSATTTITITTNNPTEVSPTVDPNIKIPVNTSK